MTKTYWVLIDDGVTNRASYFDSESECFAFMEVVRLIAPLVVIGWGKIDSEDQE